MFILKHFRITIRLRKKSVPLLLISSLQELESCNEVSLEFSMSQLKDGETHCFFHSLLVCWFFFLCFLSLSAYSSAPRSSQKWFCVWIYPQAHTHKTTFRQTYTFIQCNMPSVCFFLYMEGRKAGWSDGGAVSMWGVHACKIVFVHR